jgi:acetoin utilization protein AcuC
MSETAFIYSDEVLKYDFGPKHPLQPVRYKLTHDLLSAYGAFEHGSASVIEPPRACDRELRLVHDAEYVDTVRRAGSQPGFVAPRAGIGLGDNPPFDDMHEVTATVAGGSIEAARRVMSGQSRFAFNIAGGLHHALPAMASGFCIYNDAAVAIAWLLQNGAERVAYIDTDAHHGDGVQWIFYEDPRVLTVSVHESGRYLFPGTGDVTETGRGPGKGTAINVPLDPGASDPDMLMAMEEVVVPVTRKFRPEVLVLQHGCDAHRLDPLTHLDCSLNVFSDIALMQRDLAAEVCGGRAISGGGGGYAYREVVPLAWAAMFSIFSGIELPSTLPPSWRKATGLEATSLFDDAPEHDQPLESTKRTIRHLGQYLGNYKF